MQIKNFILAFVFIAIFCIFFTNNTISAINPTTKTVYVKTVTAFYHAIDSNTTIILAPGDYHLNQIDTTLKNPNCNWATVLFDEIYKNTPVDENKTLLISNLKNLKIKAANGTVKILTNRRSATVLAFKNCRLLTLSGITFGHDIKYTETNNVWSSFCSGEVLKFMDCKFVLLEKSTLFGFGTRGFLLHRCRNITVSDVIIKECSFGAFGIFNSNIILLRHLNIKDNLYRKLFEIQETSELTLIKTTISKNVRTEYSDGAFVFTNLSKFKFSELKFINNDFTEEEFETNSNGLNK